MIGCIVTQQIQYVQYQYCNHTHVLSFDHNIMYIYVYMYMYIYICIYIYTVIYMFFINRLVEHFVVFMHDS